MNEPLTPEVTAWIDAQENTQSKINLSVVIPAYNEQLRLPPTLIDTIDYLDSLGTGYEILVVDDGSRDETAAVVKKFEKIRPQIRLITLPKNAGKGNAVRTGVLNARGEIVLFADADGSTPIQELDRLKDAIDNGADLAFGSRAAASSETKVKALWHRRLMGRTFNWFVSTVILPDIEDSQCGFKMFRSGAAQYIFSRQTADGFNFDVELLFIARKAGYKIKEVPVNWTNVPGSKVNLIKDSLKMLYGIFFFRIKHKGINPEDRIAEEQAKR